MLKAKSVKPCACYQRNVIYFSYCSYYYAFVIAFCLEL